jgi:membrane fusion protein (multidrug efflux system)
VRSRIRFLAAAALALSGCTKPHSAPAADLPPVRVAVAPATVEDLAVLTAVTGTIRPVQRATIAAKVMGVIEQLPVSLGQRVAAGDLLVQLAAADLAARVAQASTQLAQARRDLARDIQLAATGAATADTVRLSTDHVALAEAALRDAETTLGYATLRAPFAGVIARRLVYAGDLASPGQPLVELEGVTVFEIEVPIPDSLVAGLTVGKPLFATRPPSDAGFTGTITELSSTADASARSVLAKIAVPAGTPVRSGQFVRVLLPGEPARTILVPIAAVAAFGQMDRVFVVSADRRAVLRLVKTGAARDDRIEILSGLDGGETVVVAPPAGLREGQPLTLAP